MTLWEQRVAQAQRLWIDGDRATAEQELRTVQADGDFDPAVHATCLLGELLDERDDVDGARAMYQRVIDSGHPIYTQVAAISLGLLLFGADDLAPAQAVLRIAADGADPDVAGRADAVLARVLHILGDVAGARDALDRALASNDPEVVRLASELDLPTPVGSATQYLQVAYAQACRLLDEGRDHDAEPVLLRLLDSGHPVYGSLSAVKLHALHVDDQETARRLAERIIDYRHPEHVGRGYALLGGVLEDQGDPAGAAEAFRRAADDPHPDVRLHALINLGIQLRELGRPDQARDTYQRVVDTRHPRYSAEALGVLAELLRDSGDVAGAVEAFGRVADSGHLEKSPLAAYNMGVLHYEQGDQAAAAEAFRKAADANDPHVAHQAELALSMLDTDEAQEEPAGSDAMQLARRAHDAAAAGDVATARTVYRQVIEMDAPGWSVRAANSLGLLEATAGDPDRARRALRWAAKSDDESPAQEGAFRHALLDEPAAGPVLQALFALEHGDQTALDRLIAAAGPEARDLASVIRAEHLLTSDVASAAELLTGLTASRNRLAWTKAGHLLAGRLIREQRHDEGLALLSRVVGEGHPALLPWAAADLGDLLLDRGDIENAIAALETASATGHVTVLGEAFGKLALIYRTWGRHDELLDLYRRTAASGHPEFGARAAFLLGEELVEANDLDSALELFTRAAAASSAAAPVAAFGMRAIRQEFESARASFLALTDDEGPHLTATQLCMNLAHRYQSRGAVEFTDWALHLVTEAGHPDLVQQGWLFLGALRNESGDVDGAVAAWQQATHGTDAGQAEVAKASLADLLREAGDGPAAVEQAPEFEAPQSHQAISAETAEERARRLMAEGDVEGARAAIGEHFGSERVADFWCAAWETDLSAAATALAEATGDDHRTCSELGLDFGHALADDDPAARGFFRVVADHGHRELVPQAQIALGELAERQRARALALAWYRRASGTGVPAAAALAGVQLAQLLARLHDLEGAKSACRHAISAGSGTATAEASLLLGQLHHDAGDLEGARQAYEHVVSSGDERLASVAKSRLADLSDDTGPAEEATQRPDDVLGPALKAILGLKRREEGDTAGASEAFREAADSDDDRLSPMATYALAQSLRHDGDSGRARQTYLRLIESAPQDRYAGEALLELAAMAFDAGDDAEAREWSLRAWESDDAGLSAKAAMNLGVIAKRRRDLDAATPWFLALIDLGHPTAALAAAHLAEMHYWREEHAEAVRHYEYTLANTQDSQLIAEAAFRVGEIHYRSGEVQQARELLHRAARTEDPSFAKPATELLAQLGS